MPWTHRLYIDFCKVNLEVFNFHQSISFDFGTVVITTRLYKKNSASCLSLDSDWVRGSARARLSLLGFTKKIRARVLVWIRIGFVVQHRLGSSSN
jgi:hypothetical protein